MKFTFQTEYDQKTIKTMAEALRKTIRKKKNRRSHIFGILVIVLAVVLTLPVLKGEADIQFRTVLTWIAALVIGVTLMFEDAINGYIAKKRMIAGMDRALSVFENDKYTNETSFGKTEFKYENIKMIAENQDYFVFIFDISHAQIYDKHSLTGGTVEEFRGFIENKTNQTCVDLSV